MQTQRMVTPSPADAPALQARGLRKRYGRRRSAAIESLDLTIDRRGLTALVGPNGAGKSTLIKTWVGLERPSAGSVAVQGIDPWQDRSAAVQRIGYVPQSPALYRGLTVSDHLELAAGLRPRFDRPHAEQRLAELGLPLRVRVAELSGGQQAQVGLALALGTRAPVLLLDEPLASLDPLARREFLHVLRDSVLAEGSTALLSSHVVTDIEQACDRLIVLGNGRKLLDESLEDALAQHSVGTDVAVGPGAGRTFIASFPDAGRERVALWRVDPDVERAAGLRRPTLEEVVVGYLAVSRARAALPAESAAGA